jgi:hypothetical protein
MTTTDELVEAICVLLEKPGPSIPVTLMNHEPQLARQIIIGVVERAAAKGISIAEIAIDPEFAAELFFSDDGNVSEKTAAKVIFEPGLGRQLLFRRATN